MIIRTIKVPYTSLVPVVEIAVGNEIRNEETGAFEFKKGEIISLCIFYGDTISILQKEKTDKESSWKQALIDKLLTMPICYSHYNLKEKDAIMGYTGLNRFFESINLFKGKGCTKENLFNALVKKGQIPQDSTCQKLIKGDIFNGDTRQIVEAYSSNEYEKIVSYLINSILKQYFIFINRVFLQEEYKNRIVNGWIQGEFGK